MRLNRRKKKLIRPALQARITLAFMATSVLVLATMGGLVSWFLTGDKVHVPPGSEAVVEQIMSILTVAFAMTMVLLVPLTLYVGLKVTHVVAGPLYRFEQYLGEVIRDEKPADCKLRTGDELGDICDLINEATRPLRQREEVSETEGGEDTERAAAA